VLQANSQAMCIIFPSVVRGLRGTVIAKRGAACFAGGVARGANTGAGFQVVGVWASLGVGKFVRRLRPLKSITVTF
jgi:hypothetical protein